MGSAIRWIIIDRFLPVRFIASLSGVSFPHRQTGLQKNQTFWKNIYEKPLIRDDTQDSNFIKSTDYVRSNLAEYVQVNNFT